MRDGNEWFITKVPYDKAFVTELKDSVDSADRWWWPELKLWLIKKSSVKEIIRVFTETVPRENVCTLCDKRLPCETWNPTRFDPQLKDFQENNTRWGSVKKKKPEVDYAPPEPKSKVRNSEWRWCRGCGYEILSAKHALGCRYAPTEKAPPRPPAPPPRPKPAPPPKRTEVFTDWESPVDSNMPVKQAAFILGVSVRATKAEIKLAARGLALKHHPDAGGSHNAMSKINVARSILEANL